MEGNPEQCSSLADTVTDSTETKTRGGYTCYVPGCYSNYKKLSFHKFPLDEGLRKKWIGNIKRKNFVRPTEHHRVCSLHFKNGKKMGSTDVPVIFPLLPKPTFRQPPKQRSTPPTTTKRPPRRTLKSTVATSGSGKEVQSMQTTEMLIDELK